MIKYKFNLDLVIRLRRENKLSINDMAKRLGAHRQSVAMWEAGLSFPTVKNIIRIMEAFSLKPDDMFVFTTKGR